MNRPNMAVFVGEKHGPALDSLCVMLSLLPPEILREAVRKIDDVDTLGPFLEPTAWLDLPRDSTRQWKRLFEHLAAASETLHGLPTESRV